MDVSHILSMAKRRFIILDLFICSLWSIFVFRLWSSYILTSLCVENPLFEVWTAPVVLYIIFLRIGASIMMLRDDKNGLWVSLLLLICSWISIELPFSVLSNAMPDSFYYINMVCADCFSPVIYWMGRTFSLKSYGQAVKITWGVFWFCWIWLLPFVYFVVRRKKRIQSKVKRSFSLSGLYLLKDELGKLYLKLSFFVLGALLIGMVMNSVLSLIGMLLFSYLLYSAIAKWEGKNIGIYQWGIIIVAMICIWIAQYQFSVVHIILLLGGILLSAISIILIYRGTRKMLRQLVLIVITGLILPSVCLGYNVFALTDYSRGEKLQAKYSITGTFKIYDALGNIGLRDRYRIIIPVLYSDIQDYHLPYLKVKKDSLWGVWNTQYASFVKGDYDQIILGPLNDRPYISFEDYSLLVKTEYTYIEPFEEDCIYFRCRKDSLEGIGYIINRAFLYLTFQPDTMLIVSEAPYFDIIKNDSMHYILDEELYLAYDTSSVSYAKRIDSMTFKLIYKKKCDGYNTLKLPTSRWGKAELL